MSNRFEDRWAVCQKHIRTSLGGADRQKEKCFLGWNSQWSLVRQVLPSDWHGSPDSISRRARRSRPTGGVWCAGAVGAHRRGARFVGLGENKSAGSANPPLFLKKVYSLCVYGHTIDPEKTRCCCAAAACRHPQTDPALGSLHCGETAGRKVAGRLLVFNSNSCLSDIGVQCPKASSQNKEEQNHEKINPHPGR